MNSGVRFVFSIVASYALFNTCQAQYFPAEFDKETIDGVNGFKIPSLTPGTNDAFGTEVRFIGDINNDGIEDMAIASGNAIVGENDLSGRAYILFGSTRSFSSPFDLTMLDGANGFVVEGVVYDERRGATLAGVGDINGDGIDDVLIGTSNSGAKTILLYGSTDFPALITSNDIDGSNGFLINATGATQVDKLGDVNGDGINDFIIATPHWSGNTWIIFGRADNFPSEIDASYLDGTKGFRTGSFPGSRPAYKAGGAGDINGDGYNDILIGNWSSSYDANGEISYALFGKSEAFEPLVDITQVDGSDGFLIDNRENGFLTFVGAIGDINGDGIDDCYSENNVILGSRNLFPSKMMMDDFDGKNGFLIEGNVLCMAPAGDINRDGIDDFMIASSPDSYVVYGNKNGFASSLNPSALDGANGFIIKNAGKSNIGRPIDGGKDINGDGLPDLLFVDQNNVYALYGSDIILSTEEASFTKTMFIYPNPVAESQIRINGKEKMKSPLHVTIYSGDGRNVYEKEGYTAGEILDIGLLEPGIYMLQALGDEYKIVERLVIY